MTDSKLCHSCGKNLDSDIFSMSYIYILLQGGQSQYISMKRLFEVINNYFEFKKLYIHLSPSELILLRPDVILDILNSIFNNQLLSWGFEMLYVCPDCFHEYTKDCPLI